MTAFPLTLCFLQNGPQTARNEHAFPETVVAAHKTTPEVRCANAGSGFWSMRIDRRDSFFSCSFLYEFLVSQVASASL